MSAPASKRRLLAMALVATLCVHLAALWTTKRQIISGRSDFSAFYAAGKLIITGEGRSLYSFEAQTRAQEQFQQGDRQRAGTLPFGHPPFELLLFAPLAALPYSVAFGIWYLVNLFLLLGTLFVVRDHVPIIRERFAIILVCVACFYPAVVTVVQGQDSILLLFLFSLVFVRLSSEHDFAAGLFLSLCTFKFQLLFPSVVALVAARRWRSIQGFAVGCTGLLTVSAALVGLNGLMQYPRFLAEYASLPAEIAAIYPEQMPNLRGLLTFLPEGRVRPLLFAAISAGLVAMLGFVFIRARQRAQRYLNVAFAACVSVTVFVAYHLNVHDVVLMALPLILTADYLRSRAPGTFGRKTLIVAALIVYFAPAVTGSYTVVITAGSILLMALLLMRKCMVTSTDEATRPDRPERVPVSLG